MATQLTCPSCRAEIPRGAAFCPACGSASPTVITNERATVVPPAPGAPPAVPTAERLVRALGPKYEVKRLIGRGGFAEVYELWDKDLDRRLACKVLHPEIAWTPGMLARFRQEAKALARLQDPAILAIHFTGDGEGLVYYVMPFVEGESLAERLRRRGPYTADEALKIAEPILQALSHAHTQGLVHRDIKPDNVMVEAKSGRVLLLDFGIAKLLDPGGGGGGGGDAGGAKTATGFTVGTVQYMSPEQALGQPNLDGRSDLYAFGAMLYQMVTGTPPYDGNSSAEIVGKHLGDPVPVASDVNAKIPRWLSTVIVKCLAKKPEDRFQDADHVLAALDSGRTSGSEGLVGAHTLERQVRRSGQVRRGSGRLGWWVAGVLGAALVAGGLARRAGYLGPGVASVHNALVEPIEILSHGVPVDTVAPEATQRLSLRRDQRGELRWRLIRPGNPPIGEPLEGPLPAFPRAGGRLLADVSAEVGGQRYFAPLITNTSASDITLEVNPATAAAVRCNCLVSKSAVRTHIGYYRLYQNTSVAAYNSAHPYIGPHADRHGFAGRVGPQSGVVVLTF
ncbi:MAG TPA: serine/threonine-protein kinase [Gemmatimonadales bacterium]|nr:serine/threonine-protein kinase [Gemmatimonadales bacterium]